MVVVLIAAAAAGGYIYDHNRTGSVYHPHAPFTPQANAKLPAGGPSRFAWPLYGYTKNHTRYFPATEKVRPPFVQVWAKGQGSLLEFPPVIYGETIYQLADDAVLTATDKYTGRTLWAKRLGDLSASTPAVTSNTLYATVLDSGHESSPGRIFALNSANGAVRWSRDLPAPSESSPLLDAGRVFFGSQNGTVYALDASTGSPIWTYHAEGAVKASPTLSEGVLYFGDYSGHVQAISESTGHRLWVSGSEGALIGSGTLLDSRRRVRAGLPRQHRRAHLRLRRAHRQARLGCADRCLRVRVARRRRRAREPTIYLGSYDGTFYALNAQTGHISWSFNAGGRISGSATIIGRIVYFADLGDHRTYGLGISTGHVVFTKDAGSFDPGGDDANTSTSPAAPACTGSSPSSAPPGAPRRLRGTRGGPRGREPVLSRAARRSPARQPRERRSARPR